MSALTAPKNTPMFQPLSTLAGYPVAANAVIWPGALVVLNSSKYATQGVANTTSLAAGCYRGSSKIDNTGGADGALTITVEEGIFAFVNGNSLTQADVGSLAYILDDQSVTNSAGGHSVAGVIYQVDSDGVWVDVGLESAIDDSGVIPTNSVTEGKLALTIYGEQALSGAGAVDVTHRTTKLTSTGAGQAITIADGTVNFQRKTIVHEVDGGSMVLTPATPLHFATITFTNVHDFAELEWTGAAWIIVGYGGVTIA